MRRENLLTGRGPWHGPGGGRFGADADSDSDGDLDLEAATELLTELESRGVLTPDTVLRMAGYLGGPLRASATPLPPPTCTPSYRRRVVGQCPVSRSSVI